MTDPQEAPLTDDDMITTDAPSGELAAHDSDGTDGHDSDGTDGHDSDGTDGHDSDGTDGHDSDGTDA